MTRAARFSVRRAGARRLVRIGRWAARVERSVWALLVSLLWPAVFALIAVIGGMVAWAALTSAASLPFNLLYSLLLALFVLVMATILLNADADAESDAGRSARRTCRIRSTSNETS